MAINLEQFKTLYNQIDESLGGKLIIRPLEVTLDFVNLFSSSLHISNFTNQETLENTPFVFNTLISRENYDALDTENKNMFLLIMHQLYNLVSNSNESDTDTNTNTTDFLSSAMERLNNLNPSEMDINDNQLSEAANMITSTLGLKNSSMGNLIQDMVGDIGKSLKSGMSINDLVTNLSQDFGNKLNDNVRTGKISKSEIENSAKNMMQSIQGLTENPSNLLGMIQGNTPETQEDKDRKKQERREKRMREARKNRKHQNRRNKRK